MSEADSQVQEALRWLRFAREDLDVAQRLLRDDQVATRHVCWLSQQAAEKALKAALTLDTVRFPFTHDLDALRNLLSPDWDVRTVHADLAELTEWGVESRYPGDWPEPTGTDAAQAVTEARLICDSIESEFSRRRVIE
jgi:HEPN domain-containing protein